MQTDRPGLIAAVSTVLAKNSINISFMTVTRLGRGQDAIMAIGLDEKPSQVNLFIQHVVINCLQDAYVSMSACQHLYNHCCAAGTEPVSAFICETACRCCWTCTFRAVCHRLSKMSFPQYQAWLRSPSSLSPSMLGHEGEGRFGCVELCKLFSSHFHYNSLLGQLL